jgi:prephenate dehydrogenase
MHTFTIIVTAATQKGRIFAPDAACGNVTERKSIHMKTYAFIGLGLIGGSIAKAIRKYEPDSTILAYARHKETLEAALDERVIDGMLTAEDPRYAQCDYIFLCAPVEFNLQYLEQLKDVISSDCILTDVGSVKSMIHDKVEELALGTHFIGGHPMAGSEKSGFAYSSDRLIENAYYILTPGNGVPVAKIAEFSDLISRLCAIPMVMTPEEHDYITASVSHLPHLIAYTLVNLVKELDDEQEHMKTVAAGGFRDITRIASSSPEVWQHICLENPKNINAVLDEYIRRLIEIRCLVDEQNAEKLYELFESAKDYRDSIDVPASGPLKKLFVLYLDIADEAGGIAAIATILASENINIKNIGIIHNREYEEGVLKIEFYDESAMEEGLALLQKRNYHVYKR